MSYGFSVLSYKSIGLITDNDHDVEHLKTSSGESKTTTFLGWPWTEHSTDHQ